MKTHCACLLLALALAPCLMGSAAAAAEEQQAIYAHGLVKSPNERAFAFPYCETRNSEGVVMGKVEVPMYGDFANATASYCYEPHWEDDANAKVICRELGYRGGGVVMPKETTTTGKYKAAGDKVEEWGSYKIKLDCNGDEDSVAECKHSAAKTQKGCDAVVAVTCYRNAPRSNGRKLKQL